MRPPVWLHLHFLGLLSLTHSIIPVARCRDAKCRSYLLYELYGATVCLFDKIGTFYFDIAVSVTYNLIDSPKQFHQMAKKKASNRYGFTPETKAEALRLIREEKYTAKQAAEYAGCSLAAIQQWKAAAKSGKIKVAVNGAGAAEPAVKSVKKARKTKRRRKGTTKKTVAVASAVKPVITFDEFVQSYWSKCDGASDILRLPADIMPKAVQYVNGVLRYAYNRFNGQ